MFQTVMVIVEPKNVNKVLAELAAAKCVIMSLDPITTGAFLDPEDVMIVYTVEHESEDASFSHLAWMEETVGPLCKIY